MRSRWAPSYAEPSIHCCSHSHPGDVPARLRPSLGAEHSEANAHFRAGLDLYRDGKVDEAVAEWRRGVELEPDNYIIRKQIWAVQNPDRFYSGDVDFAWQKQQMAQGL